MSSTVARGRTLLTRGTAALAAGVLAVSTLAGCSTPAGTPGAAAVVDGRTISVAEVSAVTSELGPLFETLTDLQSVAMIAATPAYLQLGSEFGAVVSTQEALTFLDGLEADRAAQAGAEPGTPASEQYSEAAVDVIRYVLTVNKLSENQDLTAIQERIVVLLEEIDAEFNPRYGSVDLVTSESDPATWPWLVETAAPAA